MPLTGSGTISINDVNTELGFSATATTGIGDAAPRALAAKPSGAIDLDDFYSKRAPEYWWNASYGLSTSGWTAIKGGLNFTFYNVSSANGSTGAYFNGTNGYGLTGNAGSDIDAKHIMMRFDSFNRVNSAMGGGSQHNIHEWNFYAPGGGFYWYHIERLTSGLTYAARGTADVGTSLIWLDFTNGGSSINLYENSSTTAYAHSVYDGLGTFNNRFRFQSGYGIYVGRRHEGNYSQYYLKELAIFTSALSYSDANAFRNDMLTRWP